MNHKSTPLISAKEAAKTLDLSTQQVRRLCRGGKLKAQTIGNSWVIDEKSVEEYGLQSAHIVAEDHVAYQANHQRHKPVALSFFSGAMGLDLGIENAGFDIRLACEVDKFCRQTIAINRPKTALLGDIRDYSAKEIRNAAQLENEEEIDLIIGGPPCQAFSTAGKRQGLNDERGNVFLKYLELAIELKPKYLVIENVRGLLSCPMEHRPHDQRSEKPTAIPVDDLKGGALNFLLSQLDSSGYAYSFNLYNAANFGTPQSRERVIIICSRDNEAPPYLIPTHSQNGDFGLPRWNTFASAVKGLSTHEHINFPEKRLKYYRMLKAGENWKKLPDHVQREALGKSYFSGGGKTGFLRRLAWDKPSPTLVTHPAMPATDLAHPELDRPLSIEEYMRVQEFPDDWKLAGPLVQRYKQVGNAVPANLGKAVGSLLINLIQGIKQEPPAYFSYSRYKNTDHESWQREFKKAVNKQQEHILIPMNS